MVEVTRSPSLIEELDRRQNQLLDDLDNLNGRVEELLQPWTKGRIRDTSPATARSDGTSIAPVKVPRLARSPGAIVGRLAG